MSAANAQALSDCTLSFKAGDLFACKLKMYALTSPATKQQQIGSPALPGAGVLGMEYLKRAAKTAATGEQ
ncbi:MAG: hypothetical protein AAGF32_01360, partial [Pseudomonadota bacterium]